MLSSESKVSCKGPVITKNNLKTRKWEFLKQVTFRVPVPPLYIPFARIAEL